MGFRTNPHMASKPYKGTPCTSLYYYKFTHEGSLDKSDYPCAWQELKSLKNEIVHNIVLAPTNQSMLAKGLLFFGDSIKVSL